MGPDVGEARLRSLGVPDVLSVLVLFIVTLLLLRGVAPNRDPWVFVASIVVTMTTVGSVMVLVDRSLLISIDRVRWSWWGVALVRRDGLVARSLPWSAVSAFRVDRLSDVADGSDRILVLECDGTELELAEHPALEHTVDRDTLHALAETVRRSRPEAERPCHIRHGATAGPARRHALVWAIPTLLAMAVSCAHASLTGWILPQDPTVLLLSLPGCFWLVIRARHAATALEVAWRAMSLVPATLVHLGPRSITVRHGDREVTLDAEISDPRDDTHPLDVALGPVTWQPSARDDRSIVWLEPVVLSDLGQGPSYRTSARRHRTAVLSPTMRRAARNASLAAACALVVGVPAACPTVLWLLAGW